MPQSRLPICLAIAACCIAGVALTQNAVGQEPDTPTPAEMFGGMNMGSMYDQLVRVSLKMTDTYLDHLSKPETAKKTASCQKPHYNALIAEGFTVEQAFILVREAGSPLALTPKAGK